jgi:putative thiamine transport system permease protein
MSERHRSRRAASGPGVLRWAPVLTVAAFGLPIAAGLLGTALPAFGVMPAIGADRFGLQPWRDLLDHPGFGSALQLTLVTGLLTTLLAVLAAMGLAAVMQQRPWGQRIGTWIAPVLAAPHSALAIGLAFLLAPSGWLVRLLSPGLTGWELPPDVSTVGHPSGWALVVGLLVKEVPYLVLMTLGALNQVNAQPYLAAARSLGYAPVQAWLKVLLPLVYPQIRLPVYAVLAFSLSVVDVSMILGPGNPPTLAVLAVHWFADPDLQRVLPASAAALLLLLVVAASIAAWHLLERMVVAGGRGWIARGQRDGPLGWTAAIASAACALLFVATVLAGASLLLWSFAQQWRYPAALPTAWTMANWLRQGSAAWQPLLHTLAIGACATALAALLVIACLENEAQRGSATARGWSARSLWLLYMPLLVPQVAFLFGVQVLLVRTRLDATLLAVVWSHLVFVLPYFFLSLADPWRAFDTRYARTAASLGASKGRVFWRIKLPILLKPTLIACAVAFAVSVGQYLPTLFAGSGRVATLTTEAVTLASGADRRVTAVWAVLQALLPFVAFAGAILLPRWLHPQRRVPV